MSTKTASKTTTETGKIKKLPPHTSELAAKAISLREQAKMMLQEAEQIETELLDRLPHNTPTLLRDGRVVTLVDQFATKNQVWKSTPFVRFKLIVQGDKTE